MQNKVKKAAVALCVGAMVLTSAPVAFASQIPANIQQEGITPYYLNIVRTRNSLLIMNRVATVDCWVQGHVNDATKAKIVVELQEKNGSSWSTIKTWSDTQYDYEAYVYDTKSVTAGKTYRLKTEVTVWEGSRSESDTLYSEEETA